MDAKANAQQLINRLQPTLVIWVKYEFWYYYLTALKKRNIPVLLVSALFRPHQPFFKWYGGIWREMLTSFSYFFVQNAASKQLLGTLGFSSNVSLCGDTRFDRVIEIAENFNPLPLIAHFCNGQPVIVAGSTWEDDEAEWIHYVKNHPEIKFIIAPHEVDAGNIKAVQQVFTECTLYSQLVQLPAESIAGMPHHVLIIDNIGMLSRLYHYADIAYVGGGFNSGGIHNVLEAAVYGKPVIHGPVYEKFSEAVGLVETGAGICINNALELEKVLNELWQDKALLQQKSQAARQFVYMGAGATGAIVQYIQEKRLLTN
jgi:3-deoxy-D-manno-octulosonic-acid transferase